jgi:fatty aldehyde-generating acyl-ACP reductase
VRANWNHGTVDTFAFIIHPIDPKRDVSRKFPCLGVFERAADRFLLHFFPPVYISEIEGITSQATGKEIKGWFIACPYTPRRMMELPERRSIGRSSRPVVWLKTGCRHPGFGRIHFRCWRCRDYNCKCSGCAGHHRRFLYRLDGGGRHPGSGPGDGDPAEHGDCRGGGATGAIGQVCAELLADDVERLYLIGRRQEALEELRDRLGSAQEPNWSSAQRWMSWQRRS